MPRLVAYEEIRHDQELIDAEGERTEWVNDLTTLALKHGFVTDYTSLVVTLEPRQQATPTAPECANCSTMWAVDSSGRSSASTVSPAGATQGTVTTTGSATSAPYAMHTNAPTTTTVASTTTGDAARSPNGAPAKVPAPSIALVLAAALGAIAIVARAKKGARK